MDDYPEMFTRFDSKLVRLKDGTYTIVEKKEVFRFQTGSIKRMEVRKHVDKACKFRFQTGSIKRAVDEVRPHFATTVSIPNWFD